MSSTHSMYPAVSGLISFMTNDSSRFVTRNLEKQWSLKHTKENMFFVKTQTIQ